MVDVMMLENQNIHLRFTRAIIIWIPIRMQWFHSFLFFSSRAVLSENGRNYSHYNVLLNINKHAFHYNRQHWLIDNGRFFNYFFSGTSMIVFQKISEPFISYCTSKIKSNTPHFWQLDQQNNRINLCLYYVNTK